MRMLTTPITITPNSIGQARELGSRRGALQWNILNMRQNRPYVTAWTGINATELSDKLGHTQGVKSHPLKFEDR